MLYVFIDESGDLGFTENSSKYYVVAAVETDNELKISRVFKKVRETLKKKKKNIPEFKFTKSDNIVRKRILKGLVKAELTFSAVILQKKQVYNYLRDQKQIIHNYLTGFIAESLCPNYLDKREIHIIIDKFINKKDRKNFDWYLRVKIENCFIQNDKVPPKILIYHENSQNSAGLQAADFIAGSIFRYYERQDSTYYDIIKDNIRVEIRKWF
jgi:hypothetical protein